ncbi:indolepyruvate oxidoreductase subunit beta family protein [Ramlibacter rhizophilus]|uniref:Indolepyruvate oxidoreductase subunit beta family protein n=1 Tax=Ramlibacter rhizophilus TaxID=1781167 RepID=A0A4Z0BT80_9BURK|nr:indolepyruvate oxidoreductase subunit beta family protein [Ramlibacter rhizophilus]TFZ01235.1 indolepyruvate oxidoreductase subunit beta family protein [Ramlibacter rhizophilus]
MPQDKAITLLVCALGGEGGGVLTEWLVETARIAGYPAQSTSIPGVAQRTGATTYYLEVFPRSIAELNGRRPIFSLNPVPGALDALVSSELLETARQIGNGMTAPGRTRVITSTSRAFTTMERMQMGDGRVDAQELLALVKSFSREHHVFDMSAVAKECGTIVSAVMLGAIAGSGLFPFKREDYEAAIQEGGAATAKASLRGFARGFEIVGQAQQQAAFVDALLSPPAPVRDGPQASAPGAPDAALVQRFPAPVREMFALGHARLVDYQGRDYAELYVHRLTQVLEAERIADPSGERGFETTTEMARWLALWMAFDDIVRVADLKSRASRWARVRGEVKATDEDLLQVWDHFKPGIPEFAALLPPALAQRLTQWDRKRIAAGKLPWALPLKVGTHSVMGMVSLRALASCKWLRVRGSRFAMEQQMIERWLQGVVEGTRRDWRLGHEIALCGRLIKGYGATNERGKENLLHVLDHLARGASPQESATAIAEARQAALADEAGTQLDAALVRHGAPPRPVKEQPIRFVRKPKAAAGQAA